MPSVEELSVTAVRSAMAPGFDPSCVATELVERSRHNVTALRMARARVERGRGWRSGPIGQRARDVLTMAIELCDESIVDATESDSRSLPDSPPTRIDLSTLGPIDLRTDAVELDLAVRDGSTLLDTAELDDTLPA